MKIILLTLGAPNDDQGNLSSIAMDRLTCTHAIYVANPSVHIICTGGFGAHFNNTPLPHSDYAKRFLIDSGVPADAFLESPLSTNTVEDFTLSKSIITSASPDLLLVITSDFHVQRARFLFDHIIHYPKTLFIPARSSLPTSEMNRLLAHEQRALANLKVNGVKI